MAQTILFREVLMFGWKVNTSVSQWVGGKKVEPE
jgi:hypothetical protein